MCRKSKFGSESCLLGWPIFKTTFLTHILTHTGLVHSGLGRFQWIRSVGKSRQYVPNPWIIAAKVFLTAAHNPEVAGSSPASATILSGCNWFQLHPLLFYLKVLTRASFVSMLLWFSGKSWMGGMGEEKGFIIWNTISSSYPNIPHRLSLPILTLWKFSVLFMMTCGSNTLFSISRLAVTLEIW